MKFHWGHGILVFLVLFVASMVFVIIKSFQQDNPLVESEYYPKGLEYQKQINRIKNANTLSSKVLLTEKGGNIEVKYPEEFKSKKPEGSLYFYRPSGDFGDLKIGIKYDSTLVQYVPVNKLLKGKYIVKISWRMDGREFYEEEVLHVLNQ